VQHRDGCPPVCYSLLSLKDSLPIKHSPPNRVAWVHSAWFQAVCGAAAGLHLLLCPARQCSRWQSLSQCSAVLQLAHFISCPQSASSVSQFQQCLPAHTYQSSRQAGRQQWSVIAVRQSTEKLSLHLQGAEVWQACFARCLGQGRGERLRSVLLPCLVGPTSPSIC
jgi:hypothetical protein